MKSVFLAVGAIFLLSASPGVALDSSYEAMSQSGSHKFYVWCTGKADYESTATGDNAMAAQMMLAKKAGSKCWPVWQGREG